MKEIALTFLIATPTALIAMLVANHITFSAWGITGFGLMTVLTTGIIAWWATAIGFHLLVNRRWRKPSTYEVWLAEQEMRESLQHNSPRDKESKR